MHKSDYIKIAQAIKEHSGHVVMECGGDIIHKYKFLESLCDILKADNPLFQSDKFKELCK